MTWADHVIVAVIAASAFLGLFRGFLREILTLVTWVIALWIAFLFTDSLAEALVGYIPSAYLRLGISFLALFFLSLLIGGLVSHLTIQLLAKTGTGGIDHTLGILFGVIRGTLIVGLFVLLTGATPLSKNPWWQNSLLISYLHDLVQWLHHFLPANITQYLH